MPFDFEGTPTGTTRIIERGVLKTFIHNTTTAKMADTRSTGNSAVVGIGQGTSMLLPQNTNIVFDNGDHKLEEMLEGSEPTIHVTCNWYTRWQNYLTGDFSTIPRDAMFLVKNGKKTPIKNIRISDNMLRMFGNITALGNDRKQILWWEVSLPVMIPSVKVVDCRITAATQ
jgi:PmbA protein